MRHAGVWRDRLGGEQRRSLPCIVRVLLDFRVVLLIDVPCLSVALVAVTLF